MRNFKIKRSHRDVVAATATTVAADHFFLGKKEEKNGRIVLRGGMGTSSNNRVAGWRLEDIDDNLAADFDGSLSGLGVDLSVASYNMRPLLIPGHANHRMIAYVDRVPKEVFVDLLVHKEVADVSIVAPSPSPYPPVAPLPCGPPGPLTSSSTSSSVGVGLAGNSNAGPLHHYAPYHIHHAADGGGGASAVSGGVSSLSVNSSGSALCGDNSPVSYTSTSPHHYAGHPAAVAAAAAAAYHHHHHHHFATSNSAYHPYSYNYSAGSANGHSAATSAYAHYPAPSSSPSALELTRRKMISRSPVSASWSEALLALPTLTGFKQEAPSPPNGEHGRVGANPSPPQTTERASSEGRSVTHLTGHGHGGDQSGYSHPFQHMLHQHSSWSGQESGSGAVGGAGPITGGVGTGSASSLTSSSSNEGMSSSGGLHQPGGGGSTGVGATSYHGEKYKYDRLNEADANADNRFQYVLAAATSIATKVNEESLTYLNQGQPYEIKMKKLGDLSNFRGKLLRSVVRLCFHERRLQYMEREQIAAWRMSRPGDRIVEIDVPLSYGIYDVVQDNNNLNVVEFVWDPTKEVGVYIKVNCISTEFTPKKHGGEKGVPFRIQVETYSHGDGDGTPKRLHVAGCQIKVFKLKGADRKHKQDREKIYKRPMAEQEKYQSSCECTILAEIPLELVYTSAIVPVGTATNGGGGGGGAQVAQPVAVAATVVTPPAILAGRTYSPTELHKSQSFTSEGCPSESPLGHDTDNVESPTSMIGSGNSAVYQYYLQPLSAEASAQQTAQWLQTNRFSSHVRTFSRFAGADILRLTRDDLIQICGLADGIRLFNALHAKALAPRLTLYLTQDQSQVFHAIFLENLSCVEIGNKLAALVQLSSQHVLDVYIEGPCGIHVLVTDEVVQNMKDESMYTVELLPDQTSDRYRLLLKSTSPH
uniref:EOG090X0AJ3 n=1 Tax=Ceriodaphnia reticulata TaxID=302197 RepID=A0A4Y7LUS9_9CRUS|nr:EOG090X0AJ3 [Ceriodaphnia reticulata]SVE73100.1 EOG090X0AJ3 [Ceriodaphnia reticulata]